MTKPADSSGTLWRLSAVYLLIGMMFFYGVEQLFLNKYLHDPSARGYITVLFCVGLVVFDIPAGILADRAGRKLCLVGACVAQMIGLVVMGVSDSLLVYLIGTVLFSLYLCLFNGAVQAFLYDWLASIGRTEEYAKRQGSMYAWWLTGAGIANLVSGFMAQAWGLRSVYFLSVLPGIFALLLLQKLHEPAFKKKQTSAWYSHVAEALGEIRTHKRVISFALQFVAATIVLLTIGEFGQLYILSFGVSTVLLGIYWAITAGFAAGGRALAHRLQSRPRLLVGLFCAVLAIFAMVHGSLGIGVFWLLYGLNEALSNVAETEIQDATSSHIRATMLSMVSFAGNTLSVPLVLAFTWYYRNHGIVAANRIAAVGIACVLLLTLLVRPDKHRTLNPSPSQPQMETSI